MKIVINADLSINLSDGSYYLQLEEFNANLSSDVINKLIDEERYDSEIFSTSDLPGGVAPEDKEKLKVNVRNGKVINDENLIFSIGELLEACGWFENNQDCTVNSIWFNGTALQIDIS